MILMNPDTLNKIAQKAEEEAPGKRFVLIGGADSNGEDVQAVVSLDKAGKGKIVGAYHHPNDGTKDSWGLSFVGAIGLMLACLMVWGCSFSIGGHPVVIAIPTPTQTQGTPLPTPTTSPSQPPTPTPVGGTPTPSTPPPTLVPPVVGTYIPHPPKQSMLTSGTLLKSEGVNKPAKGDITQHEKMPPDFPAEVRDEIPASVTAQGACLPPGAAANCDSYDPTLPWGGGHYSDPTGANRTCMWWYCGGSDRYKTLPRDWDFPGRFDITVTSGIHLTYGRYQSFSPQSAWEEVGTCTVNYPAPDGHMPRANDCRLVPGCYRDDWHNYCLEKESAGGPPVNGTVQVCLPWGAATVDGIQLPFYERCGIRPVLLQ